MWNVNGNNGMPINDTIIMYKRSNLKMYKKEKRKEGKNAHKLHR